MLSKRKTILLSALTIAIALLIIEGILRLTFSSISVSGRKDWILDDDFTYFALCYSSPPWGESTPIQNTRLPPNRIEYFMRTYPGNWYCIEVDVASRLNGPFKGRSKNVILAGDSFAFGEGNLEKDSPPHLFSVTFPSANFIAAARPALDLKRASERALEFAKANQAREIIYIYNLNDIEPAADRSTSVNIFDFNTLKPSQFLFPEDSKGILGLINLAWFKWETTSKTIAEYKRYYFSDEHKTRREEYKSKFQEIVQRMKASGGRVRLIIYPLIYKDLLGNYPFLDIHAEVMKWCTQWEIACLDAYESLNNSHTISELIVHPVDYHPNGIMQREFVKFIEKSKFLDDLR